jgi:hypothetical protein
VIPLYLGLYLARVKQSKELGIGLNDKTLAYLTDEEYSQVVNLAQKSNGSSNAGNAGKFSVFVFSLNSLVLYLLNLSIRHLN